MATQASGRWIARRSLLALLASPAHAQGPPVRPPKLPELRDGMWRVYAHAPAYNASLTWYEGTLLWQGRTYRITVEGIDSLDVDVMKLWVTGRVDGLRRIEDLAPPFTPDADPVNSNPDISTGLVQQNAAGVRLRIVDATILEIFDGKERANKTSLGVDFGGIRLRVLP